MIWPRFVVPTLSQVLSQPQHKLREQDCSATCEQCQQDRSIADCKTNADADVRSYRCFQCGDLLVLIGHPTDRPITREGCTSRQWWSVRPTAALFVPLGQSRLMIPSVPRAPLFGEPLI